MPPFTDPDPPFRVQEWTASVHIKRELSPGKYKIQIGENAVIGADLIDIRGGLFTETGEDDLNLLLFFRIKLLQLIVQLDNGHRLDKESGTGGGLIVDQTAYLSAVFCFDRDTVTVAAHGDDRILQTGAQRSVYQTVQRRMDLVIESVDAPADSLQRTAGIVADLLLADDAALDFICKERQRLQLFKIAVKTIGQILLCIVASVCFHTGRLTEQPADAQQFPGAECASDLQPLHRFFHRGGVAERDPAFPYNPCKCGGSLLLRRFDPCRICHWLQAAAKLLSAKRRRLFLQHENDFIVFQFG